METTPVTPEGLQKLKDQLAEVGHKIPQVTERLAQAREMGDLGENAEYHAAREELGWLRAREGALRSKIANCRVIDPSDAPRDLVVMGATVKLKDLANGREVVYILVGEGEGDPLKRRILTTSPIGKALLRRKVGDEVEVEVPRGLVKYEVIGIEYE